jgi:aconitate hydratase
LVVAYALAGRVTIDLEAQPIGHAGGRDVFLADIWPAQEEVQAIVDRHVDRELFSLRRAALTAGSPKWDALQPARTKVYEWADTSGYVARPPFFAAGTASRAPGAGIRDARVLLLLGDGVTTDDISPAGKIVPSSDAGRFLAGLGVSDDRMHTFGARRGHWEVMLRGAFTNPNLVNEMAPEFKGGHTRMQPDGAACSVLDAARSYQQAGTATVIVAGKNYGTGSSRDDAARSTRLLGVGAVIAESFERIHRSNLAALGVMPLLFPEGVSRTSLGLDGSETFTMSWGDAPALRGQGVDCVMTRADGRTERIALRSALRSDEAAYYTRGGILPYLADRVCEPLAAE